MENPSYNYSPAPVSQTNTMAIVSLVAGLAGWFLLPLLGAVVAIITGHMAKKEIKLSGGAQTGDGLATAGLVLGYANIALGVCGICAFIAFMLLGGLAAFSSDFSLLSFLPLI